LEVVLDGDTNDNIPPADAAANPTRAPTYVELKQRWALCICGAEIKANARLLALLMLQHVNYDCFAQTGEFESFQEVEILAAYLRLDKRTVRKLREELRGAGILIVVSNKGGRFYARYRFARDWIDARWLLVQDSVAATRQGGLLMASQGGPRMPSQRGQLMPGQGGPLMASEKGDKKEIQNEDRERKRRPRKRKSVADAIQALRGYEPSPSTIAWASENCGAVTDPCGPHHVGKFVN
jgi:hypothetical protein